MGRIVIDEVKLRRRTPVAIPHRYHFVSNTRLRILLPVPRYRTYGADKPE